MWNLQRSQRREAQGGVHLAAVAEHVAVAVAGVLDPDRRPVEADGVAAAGAQVDEPEDARRARRRRSGRRRWAARAARGRDGPGRRHRGRPGRCRRRRRARRSPAAGAGARSFRRSGGPSRRPSRACAWARTGSASRGSAALRSQLVAAMRDEVRPAIRRERRWPAIAADQRQRPQLSAISFCRSLARRTWSQTSSGRSATSEQLLVAGRDQAVVLEAVVDPAQHRPQNSEPTRMTGKCLIRWVWIRVRLSKSSSRVPKPPGKMTKARA